MRDSHLAKEEGRLKNPSAIGLPLLNRHHRPSWQVHDNRSNWGAKKGNISFGVVGWTVYKKKQKRH